MTPVTNAIPYDTPNDWENRLLKKATPPDAFPTKHNDVRHTLRTKETNPLHTYIPPTTLKDVETITKTHSSTFYLATIPMPRDIRLALRILYAFARISDNLVDHSDQPIFETGASMIYEPLLGNLKPNLRFDAWLDDFQKDVPQDPILNAWKITERYYGVPPIYSQQLLEGLSLDITKKRYMTFSELADYAYGVASTVGLMSMYIIGFSTPQAVSYAVKMGVALQLTNILRDIREDWERGRLYVPLDELHAYGLDEHDIARGEVTDRFRAFMRMQISRVRELYRLAFPGICLLHRRGRFAVALAARLYASILTDIEANDYDVFHRRAHVKNWKKLLLLPGIYWETFRL
ncbi:MAG: phytoene/squalene synthase family protein [Candidatus Carbobacillus sp.]|nr:phytoene/squalene synthase family protein [Candidatus Carbobacillus sp.]